MWSLGCIVYEMVALRVPFPRYPLDITGFCRRGRPFPIEPLEGKLMHSGVKFVQKLLVPTPADRLPASEALKDEWFASSDASPASREILGPTMLSSGITSSDVS